MPLIQQLLDPLRRCPEQRRSVAVRTGVVLVLVLALCAGAFAAVGTASAVPEDTSNETIIEVNETTSEELDDTFKTNVTGEVRAVSEGIVDQEAVPPILDGRITNSNDEPIDQANVIIEEIGGDEYVEAVSFEGRWAVPLPEGTYQVESSVGDFATETEVVHEEGEQSDIDVIQVIERCEADTEIVANPDEIETFEEVTFRVCPSALEDASEYVWQIGGDQQRVSGVDQAPRTVTHEFSETGNYVIEVENSQTEASASKIINVDGSDLAFFNVGSSNRFWVFQGLGFDAAVWAEGVADNDLETAEVTITEDNGEVILDKTIEDPEKRDHIDKFQIFENINTSEIDDDAVMDFKVTDTEGNIATTSGTFEYFTTPSWLEWGLGLEADGDDASVEIKREGEGTDQAIVLEAERNLVDFTDPIDELPDVLPANRLVEYEIEINKHAEINFGEREIGGGAEGNGTFGAFARSGEAWAEGTMYVQPRAGQSPIAWYDRTEVGLGARINVVDVKDTNIDLSPVASAEGDLRGGPYLEGETDVLLATDWPPFGFEDTRLGTGVEAEGEGEIEILGGVAGSGDIEGDGRLGVEFSPALDVPPWTDGVFIGELNVEGSASLLKAWECTVDSGYEFEGTVSDPDSTFILESGCSWDVSSPLSVTETDSNTTLPTALTSGEQVQPSTTQNADNFVRLTDREGGDVGPALALRSDNDVLAWTVEHGQANESRMDVAVNVGDHTEPESITRDQFLTGEETGWHSNPTAERSDDDVLVSWTAFDNSTVEELEGDEVASEYEVGYAIHDGSTWTSPSLLTGSELMDHNPTVASVPEGWVIAWQQNDDIGINASERIRYATVTSNGTVSDIETIESAVGPELGVNGEDVDLAYKDTEADELVHERLIVSDATQPPERTAVATHDTDSAHRYAAGGGAVAWAESSRSITYATGATVDSISIEERYEGIRSIDIIQTQEGTALTFRGGSVDSSGTDIAYILESTDTNEWSAARPIVEDPDHFDLSQETVAPTEDGFLTTFVGSVSGADGEEELFAATGSFAPDYRVELATAPDNLEPNEQFDVNVTVSNVGDVPATEEVDIELTAAGSEFDIAQVAPLEVGENTTVSLRGETNDSVPSTATVEVDTEGSLTQHTEDNSAIEIDLATPEVSVRKADEYSTSNGNDTATVEFNATNTGVVVPDQIAVEVINDGDVIGATTVESLPPSENTSVAVNVNRTAVNQTLPTSVHATEGDTTVEDRPISLLDPSLSVSDSVQFVETQEGTFARLTVTNEGIGGVETAIRSKQSENGNFTEFATTDLVLDGTAQGNSTTTTVLAPIGNLNEGDTVRFIAGDTLNDRTPVDNILETEVETIVPLTGTLDLTAVDRINGTSVENATITVGAELDRSDAEQLLRTNSNGSTTTIAPVGELLITANKTGYVPTEQTVTIKQNDDNNVTVELSPDTDRALIDYTDEKNIVRLEGVRDAITDWQGQVIDTELLVEVIDAWSSSEPVS